MSWWRSAVAALCFVFLFLPRAEAGPSYEVFSEALNQGEWLSQPWGATVTTVTAGTKTAPAFKGTKVAKTSFTQAMGVFKQFATGGFPTEGYRNLTLAVYNAGNADDLWFVAETTGGQLGTYLRLADYSPTGTFPVSRWTWVRIPVYHMGLGYAPTLKYFSVSSGKANATAYFDDVQFSSNVTLYEGIRYLGYMQHYSVDAPGSRMYSWTNTIGPTLKKDGEYSMSFTTTGTWGGGVQFQQVMSDLYSPDFGGLAIRYLVTTPDTGCYHYVQFVDSNNNPAGEQICLETEALTTLAEEGGWRRVTIPMSRFRLSGPTFLGGVIVSSAVQYDRMDIDDVRLVQKLQWMMPTIGRSAPPNSFGEHWQKGYCDGYDELNGSNHRKIHVGVDYTDGLNQDREVRSASRGVVKRVLDLGYWAWAVVVYHESNFATSYLHLKAPYVQEGQEVQRGTLLGKTAYIEDDGVPISHLHFGVRLAPYSEQLSIAGALPQQSCTIKGVAYPGVWQSFINSQRLDW